MSGDAQIIVPILILVAVVLIYCFRAIWVLSRENCEYEQRQKDDEKTIEWQGREIAKYKEYYLNKTAGKNPCKETAHPVRTVPPVDEWEDLSRRYIEYWKTFLPIHPER